ncbi:MAG TPA: YggS family pyridoxal phosphate-dependent enzyme, partial [Thiotrichales bacterium]|nr:YggS family pyridoxal phosphate-dependent enzyme [Thiotrichales bacterium]
MSDIAENYARVLSQVEACAKRAGRSAESVRLIAVSKTRRLEEVQALLNLGQLAFGENTIQDAMTKIPALSSTPAEWHFIGHLQSKKAGRLPGYFQWVHSVDSLKLAQKLSSAMLSKAPNTRLNCLIQVNVSGEATKSGLQPHELGAFMEALSGLSLPGLHWRGLMTIGVKGNESETRAAFAHLRRLQQSCQSEYGLPDFDQL